MAEFGLILISICIIGATIYTTLKELVSTPSVLMRPKAPKGGNRVIMEKIAFIWKRLNFSQKVTVRNIFRYKKRFFMTIIGILGCTALILTGFGVYPKIAKVGGAGCLVPITGFANGVVSPAIEFKTEGQIFGVGAKIFTIAGPVILYGIFSSWLAGVIYLILKYMNIV